MRLIPDSVRTVGDLIDFAKQSLSAEDAALLIRLLESEYDQLTS